jgi:putative flippase GtrA
LPGISELDAAEELLPAAPDGVARPEQPEKRSVWQMVRFGMVGIANTLIDLLTLNLLLWLFPPQNASLLLLYNSIAVILAALNSFVWNKYWTFRRRRATTPPEIARFALVAAAGFLCNDALVWLVGRTLHSLIASPFLWANLAKVCATGGTMIVTYLGMRFWVFAGTSQAKVKTPKPT